MVGAGEAVAAAIDGTDPSSWRLPLAPLGQDSVEPWPRGDEPELDRLEAAAAMVKNSAAIVKFAARATGKPATRRVSAPLADPHASHWEVRTHTHARTL